MQRPLRVVVVGSGPAGLFTASEAIHRLGDAVAELVEREPVGGGLIRRGVAPDHPLPLPPRPLSLLAPASGSPRLLFRGNLALQSPSVPGGYPAPTLCVDNLLQHFPVILCAGAEKERTLGLLRPHAVVGAQEMVEWYNRGLLGSRDPTLPGRVERAVQPKVAVVGAGNVALDISRVLLKSSFPAADGADGSEGSDMAKEDAPDSYCSIQSSSISHSALGYIQQHPVHSVHLFARRGPVQASFTNKEIREILDSPWPTLVCGEHLTSLSAACKQEMGASRIHQRMMKLLLSKATLLSQQEMLSHLMEQAPSVSPSFYVHFFMQPTEYCRGTDGALTHVVLERTRLHGPPGSQRAEATGEKWKAPFGGAVESVGYKVVVPHHVPQDPKTGEIPHCGRGRVIDQQTGQPIPGLYVSGWMKRGPSGVIGTNQWDAQETIDCLVEDLKEGRLAHLSQFSRDSPLDSTLDLLSEEERRRVTSFADWMYIEKQEVERGAARNKRRERFSSAEEMMEALRG